VYIDPEWKECQTSRGAIDYDRDDASVGVRSCTAAVVDPVVQADCRVGGATAVSGIEADLGTGPRGGSQGRIGMRNFLDCVRKEMWEIENNSRARVGRCGKNYFLQVLRSCMF
jgi:hypothetical protein